MLLEFINAKMTRLKSASDFLAGRFTTKFLFRFPSILTKTVQNDSIMYVENMFRRRRLFDARI